MAAPSHHILTNTFVPNPPLIFFVPTFGNRDQFSIYGTYSGLEACVVANISHFMSLVDTYIFFEMYKVVYEVPGPSLRVHNYRNARSVKSAYKIRQSVSFLAVL